jgi:hypothetical protein
MVDSFSPGTYEKKGSRIHMKPLGETRFVHLFIQAANIPLSPADLRGEYNSRMAGGGPTQINQHGT